MERQRVLAAGTIALCALLESRGVPSRGIREEAHRALDEVPDAARWASTHVSSFSPRHPRLDAISSELIVATAVVGAARACIDDPDEVLIRMLTSAVGDAEQLVRPAAAETRVPEPVPA